MVCKLKILSCYGRYKLFLYCTGCKFLSEICRLLVLKVLVWLLGSEVLFYYLLLIPIPILPSVSYWSAVHDLPAQSWTEWEGRGCACGEEWRVWRWRTWQGAFHRKEGLFIQVENIYLLMQEHSMWFSRCMHQGIYNLWAPWWGLETCSSQIFFQLWFLEIPFPAFSEGYFSINFTTVIYFKLVNDKKLLQTIETKIHLCHSANYFFWFQYTRVYGCYTPIITTNCHFWTKITSKFLDEQMNGIFCVSTTHNIVVDARIF